MLRSTFYSMIRMSHLQYAEKIKNKTIQVVKDEKTLSAETKGETIRPHEHRESVKKK